jgi:hypothetical protein
MIYETNGDGDAEQRLDLLGGNVRVVPGIDDMIF